VLVGASPDQIAALLGELETAGVFSRTRAGVIYSRKMSSMAKKTATAQKNGKKGGNPNLSKQKENSASDNPPVKDGDKTQKLEPELDKKEEPNGSSKKSSSIKGTRLPEDWVLSRTLGQYAIEQGLNEIQVRREAENFRDYWISVPGAKGVKLNWDATWRNWVRKAADRQKTNFRQQRQTEAESFWLQ
jgi:hypothetical protein